MRAFFGGPDKPPGRLRDILAERIAGVPAGGEILWATYYFRDMGLADSLIAAGRRGAAVKLCLEAHPRMRTANEPVRRRLAAADGLGQGFRAVSHGLVPAHLHEKIYIFSHPKPTALVGSFNPSGSSAEDAELIREIGDQDRGHNYLVEIDDPLIVEALRRHVLALFTSGHHALERFSAAANENPGSAGLTLFYFPRRDSAILPRVLGAQRYERVRIAASHFRDRQVARVLARLARGGTSVEVIAHDSLRRVPGRIVHFTARAGVRFHRYAHPQSYPMHSKFVLLTGPGVRRVFFGSMNLTRTSRWLNHEILAQSGDPALFSAFDTRWEEMLAEVKEFERDSGNDRVRQ